MSESVTKSDENETVLFITTAAACVENEYRSACFPRDRWQPSTAWWWSADASDIRCSALRQHSALQEDFHQQISLRTNRQQHRPCRLLSTRTQGMLQTDCVRSWSFLPHSVMLAQYVPWPHVYLCSCNWTSSQSMNLGLFFTSKEVYFGFPLNLHNFIFIL